MNSKELRNSKGRPDLRPLVLLAVGLLILLSGSLPGLFPARQIQIPAHYVWLRAEEGRTAGLYRVSGPSPAGKADDRSMGLYRTGPARLALFFFQPIPINRADAATLVTIRGIGPKLAHRIIRLREERGRFRSVGELLAVRGIGRVKLARIGPQLSFQ